jgi:hypothetical protein
MQMANQLDPEELVTFKELLMSEIIQAAAIRWSMGINYL